MRSRNQLSTLKDMVIYNVLAEIQALNELLP